jgi:hypothetical protein
MGMGEGLSLRTLCCLPVFRKVERGLACLLLLDFMERGIYRGVSGCVAALAYLGMRGRKDFLHVPFGGGRESCVMYVLRREEEEEEEEDEEGGISHGREDRIRAT